MLTATVTWLSAHRWTGLLREGIDLLGPGTPAGARLAEHATFIDFVIKEFPGIIQRREEYRAALPDSRR